MNRRYVLRFIGSHRSAKIGHIREAFEDVLRDVAERKSTMEWSAISYLDSTTSSYLTIRLRAIRISDLMISGKCTSCEGLPVTASHQTSRILWGRLSRARPTQIKENRSNIQKQDPEVEDVCLGLAAYAYRGPQRFKLNQLHSRRISLVSHWSRFKWASPNPCSEFIKKFFHRCWRKWYNPGWVWPHRRGRENWGLAPSR